MFVARSIKDIKHLSSVDRALITISDDVKEILVGMLLGDAHIVKRSSLFNSRLVKGNRTKKKCIVLYLPRLCNFLVLMYLNKCFKL